ncbi:MAG: hypothetical protein IKI40_10120 [Treponema sp.]|nr:hypothetical protein [Treponema sp.]
MEVALELVVIPSSFAVSKTSGTEQCTPNESYFVSIAKAEKRSSVNNKPIINLFIKTS